ncbi:MAG: S41 family peptidase [Bacteroidaceae bacterium]|nr:S41 family peptidase [Bacteroidaceae bacterium]MBR7051432.1 S41 family peptidase [Bacteroidaceae bacterium]
MNNRNLTPIFLVVAMVVGILIGTFYASHFMGNRLNIINTGSNKLNYLLQLVDNNYVDTVDMSEIVEESMPLILSELDPHSAYIPAKDAEAETQDLKGSFSGVGITFSMIKDTVNVMSVIKGGPAEKVGLVSGDRIISADGVSLVKMEQTEVMRHLKGEKGTMVRLKVMRPGQKNLRSFAVVRGDIPVLSVDVAYMIDETVGYIHVKNFGEQTFGEFLTAMAALSVSGMKGLVLDLRGNRGGYMHVAIQMVNEFLPEDCLVVYTEGRRSPREDYYSDGRGSFSKLPLVVLTDEMSASASEIFAGAIQDNDRGTIVGRRTFGKGLVQQPMEFRDGSIVRLTVARYYTPSGRCIQKPYESGKGEDYENDLIARYERGEYFSEDSIHQDGKAYETSLGRKVYGGGGIMPDIFVGEDTTGVTSYYKEALYLGLVRQFCYDFTDQNRPLLRRYKSSGELAAYLKKQDLLERFASYAASHGLARRNLMLRTSARLFEKNILSSIIYNMLEVEAFQEYVNLTDATVLKALEVLHSGTSFPVAPTDDTQILPVVSQ